MPLRRQIKYLYLKTEKNCLKSAAILFINGNIVDEDGNIIDEVLVIVMRAPNTYTREDVVEIDCHGGILVTRKVLEAAIKAGAKPAEPGEFTKRAFLNGRIDLSQAEAVIDVINSKNEYALKSSVSQLDGKLSAKIKEIREVILNHVAYIEAALDDPEHISLDNYVNNIEKDVDNCVDNVYKLLKTSDNGRIMRVEYELLFWGKLMRVNPACLMLWQKRSVR